MNFIKENALIAVAFIILLFSILNAFNDTHEMDEHYEFFQEMRAFKEAGGRNTASQGQALCERINHLETLQGVETSNCAIIYQK